MLGVGYNITPRDPKGEGGYEDIKFSKCSGRYYCVHEETGYFYQSVWPNYIKDTYFSDIWFSSVKTAEEMVAA